MSILDSGLLKIKTGPKALFLILKELKKNGESLFAWKLFGKNKLSVPIGIEKILNTNDQLQVVCQERNLALLNQIISGEEVLNFFIPSEDILFQTKILKFLGEDLLLVSLPHRYAQVERRKHLRWKVVLDSSIKVRFKIKYKIFNTERGQAFEKSCFDISAGGVSININKSETKFFSISDRISNLELHLGKNIFKLSAHVVNVIEIVPNKINQRLYKGWKICLKFDKLSSLDQEKINLFVFGKVNVSPPAYGGNSAKK